MGPQASHGRASLKASHAAAVRAPESAGSPIRKLVLPAGHVA